MKHQILCIDDETHNLEALERLLRKNNHVVTALSGEIGLKSLENNQFSLIISDQKMPNMTGVEFFARAKIMQPDAIRVLLTGYTDLESVIGAINQGQIYRYITKPWDPDEFLSIVNQALEVFEMKQTIRTQNEELQKANQELESLDQLKTDFMLLVNHELKTPLTAITSFTQLLSEEKLSPEQKLFVEKINKNTQRLQDLINDTLLITRLKTAALQPHLEDIDMVKMIETLWNDLEKNFSGKKLKLKIQPSKPFHQQVNRQYIEIVLKKLIHNNLTHSLPDSEISISLKENKDHWTLESQNPVGQEVIATAKELLSPFKTSEKILNHTKGTGLGLAVIQTIVNLFSGAIDIETKNKSFKITLKLPKN